MLTSNISRDANAALEYYQQSLSQGDYYIDKNVAAFFRGKASQFLELESMEVNDKTFSSLLHGIPLNGKKLRVRDVDSKRVGYDFTVNCPKAISVLHSMTDDPAIIEVLEFANTQMMKAVEEHAQYQENTETARIYKDSKNIIYSSFLHRTTRPNEITTKEGCKMYLPDPHLHIHNYIHSVTYNDGKKRFQALELGNVYRLMPYFEAVFHSHLSYGLNKAGYQVKRTHDRYTLIGVSQSISDRFSNRTHEIKEYIKKHGITDPKAKSEIGVRTRQSKRSVKESDLFELWKQRLSSEELETLKTLKGRVFKKSRSISAKEAVGRAISHHLERNAAAPTKRVLATALTLGYGHLLPEDVSRELNSRDNILRSEFDTIEYLTTVEMVRAEDRLIKLATNGKGKLPPLNPHHKPRQDFLNSQQRKAIKEILNSSDLTLLLRGSAGVGKTLLLTEVKNGAMEAGKSLFAVAPSTQATKVLKEEGFDATTVAALLHNPKLQEEKLRNQILILDEAGQCPLQDMSEILALAKKYSTRTILSGDTKQHAPVGQDAMRILETQAQIQTVTVNKIMRQKPKAYRTAIQKLAVGRTLEGYQDLNRLGFIKEIPDHDKRLNKIADDYIRSITNNRSALIISPTNMEGEQLNQVVREKLKAKGHIKGKEQNFDTLKNLSFTESQKKDLVNYSENQIVRFTKNQKGGFKAGSRYEILPIKNQTEISIRDLKSGEILKLPHDNTQHFQVFQKTKTQVGQGDLIRLTQNAKTSENTKVNNGNTYRVESFTKNGIKLNNGKTLSSDMYHFKHGYTETSHSSQGKTTDDVFISMSDVSFSAVNEQTLYVAASRGKYSASIYTSSKDDLKRAIARTGQRVSAREVADGHYEKQQLQRNQIAHHRALNEKIREHGRTQKRDKQPSRGISKELPRH